MRPIRSLLRLALGSGIVLSGCSGGKDAGPVLVPPVDSGAADAGDAAVAEALDAGGLGAALSWYCPYAGASCRPSEITAYNRCLLDRCQPALDSCPCEAWINCTTRCSCNDLRCRAVCVPTFACLECGQAVAQCVTGSGCDRPACYERPLPDAAPPGGGGTTVIVVPPPVAPDAAAIADGSASLSEAGPARDGGLQGTCVDLRRCCESLATTADRTTCQSHLMLLSSDPLCAAALLVYRGNGMCR